MKLGSRYRQSHLVIIITSTNYKVHCENDTASITGDDLIKRCMLLIAGVLINTSPATADQIPPISDQITADRPEILVVPIQGDITVDGLLEEPVWKLPATNGRFIQSEPREGERATQRTDIWIAADDAQLYVAAYLHDSEEPTVSEIKRDFSETNQDGFQVILDTFRDRRNGYVFMTNPEGARGDRQVANEGREVNSSWDAIWTVETARAPDGWTVEMAIPFRALRFDVKNDRWGINFARLLRRNNEIAHWAPIPRAYNLYRLSLAGDLVGLPQASGGRDLRVKPFGLTSAVRGTGEEKYAKNNKVGVDLKYRLTEGLTLDLTAFPDFAQVEADEQRVNLTQFSLFFQEKREFFLENSGLFYVGDAPRNIRVRLTPTSNTDLLPFFSRRIGINDDGIAQPIKGGARLTGKISDFMVGALWMRTDQTSDNPGNDYAVLRVRKNLLSGSDIGGIFMTRNSIGEDSNYNRVYGLDSFIRFPGDFDWSTYYLSSQTGHIKQEGQNAWRSSINREGNFHHIKFGLMELGEGFQNDLGFLKRTGIRKYFIDWGIRPRPEPLRKIGIREVHPHITWNYYNDIAGGIRAKRLHSGVTLFLESGGSIQLASDKSTEVIDLPFRIDGRIESIPEGRHDWTTWVLSGSTNSSRPVSLNYRGTLGGLWSGTQRSISGGITLRPSYKFRTSISVNRTSAKLNQPDASFLKTFWTSRTNYSFHKNMFIDTLLQWDPSRRLLNSNVRFNLIHRPLSDLFVVWNEQRFETGEGIIPGRSFTMKVNRMIAF